MPIFYFHLQGRTFVIDKHGHNLADIHAAQHYAAAYAAELLREPDGDFWSGREMSVTVTNDKGLILFSIAVRGTYAMTVRAPKRTRRK